MIHWMRGKRTFLLYALLVLLCLCVTLGMLYGVTGLAGGQDRLSFTVTRLTGDQGWTAYVVEDGVRRVLPYENGYFRGLAYEGQTFYMVRTLTGDDTFPGAGGGTQPVTLYVRALWGHLSVFLDGVLAYTDSPEQPETIGEIAFDRAQPRNLEGARARYYGSLAALPLGDYEGVTVTVAQNEIGTGMGERLYTCDAYLHTAAADSNRYILSTFLNLVPPLALLVAGLTLCVLFL